VLPALAFLNIADPYTLTAVEIVEAIGPAIG
jgi:hypothetical protein